jgi:putative transposase
LDEVLIRIRGNLHYLWRAVDQKGTVLDIFVKRRDTEAAKRFFRKLIKGQAEVPRVIVADKLKSHATAKRELLPQVEHRQSRYLNNRVEVSHQPTRRRERQMHGFKSARQGQRFLSAHSRTHSHFQLRRHLTSAAEYLPRPILLETQTTALNGYRMTGTQGRVGNYAVVSIRLLIKHNNLRRTC